MRSRLRSTPAKAFSDPGTDSDTSPDASGFLEPSRALYAPVTLEEYEKGREAYLREGTVVAVQNAAGISKDKADRIVYVGVKYLKLPSLQQVAREIGAQSDRLTQKLVEAEVKNDALAAAKHLDARRALVEEARKREAAYLADAASSKADEAKLVRNNRIAGMVLAQVGGNLLRVAGALSEDLLEASRDGSLKKMGPKNKLELVRHIAQIAKFTADVSQKAVHMERLLMGEPTQILGAVGASTHDMSPEEAEQWFTLAQRAFTKRALRMTPIDASSELVGESNSPEHPELYEDGEEDQDA